MLLKPFRMYEPGSAQEAAALLSKHGDNASLYAGGTELLLSMKQGLLQYEYLIDVKGIPELYGISWHEETGSIRIGAGVSHTELAESQLICTHLPVLSELEKRVANVRVRNAGTIGGNLCFGDPHSDPGTLLVALGASFELVGPAGARTVPAEEFCVGAYVTVREPDEIMTCIHVPSPGHLAHGAYQKFNHLERPAVGVAVILWERENGTVEKARVAVGCVTERAVRLPQCEELLVGRSVAEVRQFAAAGARSRAAEAVDPVGDLNGSAEYKRHLTGVLLERAILQVAGQFGGTGERLS